MNLPPPLIPRDPHAALLWRERLPSASLITAQPIELAHAYAAYLIGLALCLHPNEGGACGQCHACHLLNRQLHPDLIVYTTAQPVENIRALRERINLTSEISERRIIYLGNIQDYNPFAANALLKMLEEPAAHSRFILSSPKRRGNLPTILSRCVMMPIPSAEESSAATFLATYANISLPEAHELLSSGESLARIITECEQSHDPALAFALLAFLKGENSEELFHALAALPDEQLLQHFGQCLSALIRLQQLDIYPRGWQHIHSELKRECSHIPAQNLHRLYCRLPELLRRSDNNIKAQFALQALLISSKKEG